MANQLLAWMYTLILWLIFGLIVYNIMKTMLQSAMRPTDGPFSFVQTAGEVKVRWKPRFKVSWMLTREAVDVGPDCWPVNRHSQLLTYGLASLADFMPYQRRTRLLADYDLPSGESVVFVLWAYLRIWFVLDVIVAHDADDAAKIQAALSRHNDRPGSLDIRLRIDGNRIVLARSLAEQAYAQ